MHAMQIVHFIAAVVLASTYLYMMQEQNASKIRQLPKGGWIPFVLASLIMPGMAIDQFHYVLT